MAVYKLINKILQKKKFTSYLELGVSKGFTIKQVICDKRYGVDINSNEHVTHHMTTDQFFSQNVEQFDLIFVDASHTHEDSLRDIENAILCLKPGGVILCHDTYPKNMFEERKEYRPDSHLLELVDATDQERVAMSGFWVGRVWRSIADLQFGDNMLEICTIELGDLGAPHSLKPVSLPFGITMLKEGEKKLLDIRKPTNYSFAFLEKNAKNLLNLVTYDELVELA